MSWQPASALASAVLWSAYVSYRIHAPGPEVRPDGADIDVAAYLRDFRSVAHDFSAPSRAPASVGDFFDPSGSQLDRARRAQREGAGKPLAMPGR